MMSNYIIPKSMHHQCIIFKYNLFIIDDVRDYNARTRTENDSNFDLYS